MFFIWGVGIFRFFLNRIFYSQRHKPTAQTSSQQVIALTWVTFNLAIHLQWKFILISFTGDGGYPLQPFLIVPFRNPIGNNQKVFNKRHATVRVRVELTIGRFKNCFR